MSLNVVSLQSFHISLVQVLPRTLCGQPATPQAYARVNIQPSLSYISRLKIKLMAHAGPFVAILTCVVTCLYHKSVFVTPKSDHPTMAPFHDLRVASGQTHPVLLQGPTAETDTP